MRSVENKQDDNGKISLTLKQAETEFRLAEDNRGFSIIGVAKEPSRAGNYSSIIVPDIIAGKPVYAIGKQAFKGCVNAYDVRLPEGDDFIEIGDLAFSECASLESIVIPKGVTKIGNCPFFCCKSLAFVSVDPDNKVYDSRENCYAIIETDTDTLIAGCIGSAIPKSVKVIGNRAFYSVSIDTVVLPEGVTELGEAAFAHYESNRLGIKPQIKSVKLPASLRKIGPRAFDSQAKLTSIKIPSSVTEIGDAAFAFCRKLSNIVIPDGVTRIGDYTFSDCKKLNKIYIPPTVVEFGKAALPIKNMVTNGGVIEGEKGSEAEKYAKSKKITFVAK